MAGFFVHEMTPYSTRDGFLALNKLDAFLRDHPQKEAIGADGVKFCDGIN